MPAVSTYLLCHHNARACLPDNVGKIVFLGHLTQQSIIASLQWHSVPRRVVTSLVCKSWLAVEAANPLQPSELKSFNKGPSQLRWHMRDTRCLTNLELHRKAVGRFLTTKPSFNQLQVLSLARLKYTYEQAESLTNIQFCSSLKVLHIWKLRPAPYEFGAREYGALDALWMNQWDHDHPDEWAMQAICSLKAGESLRKAISKLPQLTALNLTILEIEDPGELFVLYPWTRLRVLNICNETYKYENRPIYAGFIMGGGLGTLAGLTELRITVPFVGRKQSLERLTNLRSLALDYEPNRFFAPRNSWQPVNAIYHPFRLDPLYITKLTFRLGNKGDADLQDLLPLQSLCNLRELTMDHAEHAWSYPGDHAWIQWPMTWSLLTNLTCLSCMLDPNHRPYFPIVLNSMYSLKRLAVSHQLCTEQWDEEEDMYVMTNFRSLFNIALEGTSSLQQLTSLVIDEQECIG